MMTICDYPDYLAVGYLVNQNMLDPREKITSIDYEEDIETVVVRTERETDFEDKLRKKTLTSGPTLVFSYVTCPQSLSPARFAPPRSRYLLHNLSRLFFPEDRACFD